MTTQNTLTVEHVPVGRRPSLSMRTLLGQLTQFDNRI